MPSLRGLCQILLGDNLTQNLGTFWKHCIWKTFRTFSYYYNKPTIELECNYNKPVDYKANMLDCFMHTDFKSTSTSKLCNRYFQKSKVEITNDDNWLKHIFGFWRANMLLKYLSMICDSNAITFLFHSRVKLKYKIWLSHLSPISEYYVYWFFVLRYTRISVVFMINLKMQIFWEALYILYRCFEKQTLLYW